MSDEPFQRPGEPLRPTSESWPYESPTQDYTPASDVDVSMFVDHEQGKSGMPTVRNAGTVRFRSVIALGAVALLAGVAIGALIIDRPIPATPITVDSFPRELLGLTREDVELRDGGSEAVIKRLDSHFEAQLVGYRFAYGGEGAQFRYGEFTTLTIVNGELAPEVPISGDTEWASPSVVSLNIKGTKCVSWEGISTDQSVVINAETGTLPYAGTEDALMRKSEDSFVWTDCVLFDGPRNLALRLDGGGPGDDIIGAAGQFRDELERIHAGLIA